MRRKNLSGPVTVTRPDPATDAPEPLYKIEKGIPCPPKGSKPIPYPFDAMDANDSFFVPIKEGITLELLRSRMANTISGYQKRQNDGRRFTVRLWSGGIRVWRTE